MKTTITFIKEGTNGFRTIEDVTFIPRKGESVHILFDMDDDSQRSRRFTVVEVNHHITTDKIEIILK